MRRLINIVLIPLLFTSLSASEVFTGESTNKPFEIYGRLMCYNGNPSLRIWIVGSKRILGIQQENEEVDLPENILKLLDDGNGWFEKEIFGDFLVEPLSQDKPGHMRPVKILEAKNLEMKKL